MKIRRYDRFGICVLLLLALLVPTACGGKKRTPPPMGGTSRSDAPGKPSRSTGDGTVRGPEETPRIRVLVKSNFESVRIKGATLAPEVRINTAAGKIQIWNGRGTRLGTGSGFRIEPRDGGVLTLGGVDYDGVLEAFVNPLGQSVIVNELDLERYLKGVVPNELNPSGYPHQEALKALTVSARTYAVASLGQYATKGFDVYSDQRSQVYRGTQSEQPHSNRIVDATRGMVATFQDKPIVAFYSSTCGGVTEDYQSVFQRDSIPYLTGGATCPDKSSPFSSWKESIRVRDIQPKLDRVAGVGRLQELVPLRKSRWGRTVEMRFVGTQGEKTLRGQGLRKALGLRSNWITELKTHSDSSGYIVRVDIKGKGWGHGVGLCQLGTVELAKRGWTYKRILKHYYRGIEVAQLW